jgi:hypothetical protein
MKKSPDKKLTLNKESLLRLEKDELAEIQGGRPNLTNLSCYRTCTC